MGTIVLEKTDGIATLTVDSPEVKNGLTPQMGRELVAACEEIDADPAIGAAVIRGAGGTFCSGRNHAGSLVFICMDSGCHIIGC